MSPSGPDPFRGRLGMLRSRLRRRRAPERAGQRLLAAFADAQPDAVFIEIGANDGKREDHLAPFIRSGRWTGVMVEPLPEVFERLQANYGDLQGVAFENVAISDHDGQAAFHTLAPGEGPRIEGADMFGSLSPAAVEAIAEAFPDAPKRVETIEVPCLTFESLCGRHGIESLDLLVIDTEGHDYEILRQVDLERLRPRVVVYEYCHLPREQRDESVARLEGLGYLTMDEDLDTWAVDVRPDDELSLRWRELCEEGPVVSEDDLRQWFEGVAGRGG